MTTLNTYKSIHTHTNVRQGARVIYQQLPKVPSIMFFNILVYLPTVQKLSSKMHNIFCLITFGKG